MRYNFPTVAAVAGTSSRLSMVALLLSFLFTTSAPALAGPIGFNFQEGHDHTTIPFERYRDLIIISTVLNDTMKVNLILDTGTRSILLCGKKFKKLSNMIKGRKMKVTGWGSSESVDADLSYPNSLSVGDIKGIAIGVAVITNRRLLDQRPQIDGIIGYELFVRFAVEINYKTKTIHLYEKLSPGRTIGFDVIPLEINMARPQVRSVIHLNGKRTVTMNLLIDTGSSLGLALFSSDSDKFPTSSHRQDVGIGLNGVVKGFNLPVRHFYIGDLRIDGVRSHLIDGERHPDEGFTFSGSLGGAFLKDHIVIFDYPSSRLFLRNHKDDAWDYAGPFPWSGQGMPSYN